MKTILHISKYYNPYPGGIESVAQQLIESLSEYRNIVICYSTDRHNHHDVINGVDVYRVGVQYNYRSQDFSILYPVLLRRLIRRYHPDAIHLHAPNPFVYTMTRMLIPSKAKLVVHWHSDILGKGKAYEFVRRAETLLLARADKIIATSPNYIYDSVPLKPYLDKVEVVPNGIDTAALDKQPGDDEEILKIRNRWPGKKLLLFVGRHIYYKGLDKLIESESYIHSDVQIIVIGDGPMSENYRAMAAQRERITFLGRVSQDLRRQYLWAADIFTFPSINKAEAFGVALAEAMYCESVPVVFHIPGSGVNWVNIKDETGMEVPLKDTQAYAKAIDQLVKDDKYREQLAVNARKRMQEYFSEIQVSKGINHLYQQLLN